MSIDPPYTAEFANAGFLAPIPQDVQSQLKQQSFKGATAAATWNGQLVVCPFWSNTQVLWYRKSFVEKAGIDMNKPVTWDQIIDAAADNGGTVAVQANKYEGYSVWINALISGAGGQIVSDADKGVDATIDVNSPAGDDAAEVIEKLAHSKAAPPDLSVSNEGTGRLDVRRRPRGVHGQLDLHLAQLRRDASPTSPRTSATRGTRRPCRASRPARRTAASAIGVSAYSSHVDEALEGRRSAWSARRTRASTPSSPATCRPARPATSTRRCQKLYPRGPADPLPAERQRGRAAHRSRRTGVTSPARSRAPGTRRLRQPQTPPKSAARSSSRSCTERACCDDHRHPEAPAAKPAAPDARRTATGAARREPARATAWSPRPSS